jgi:lycopene cyclase domain-containing protein
VRLLYLFSLLVSWAGMLGLERRHRLGASGPGLLQALAVTVPLFLVFDAVGAARGWFHSDPRLNSLILPPGIPLEEPLLLGFLTLLAVFGYRLALRLLP